MDAGPIRKMAHRARSLHVLIVDDSAVVRQSLSALLGGERGLTVSTAADPLIALGKMKKERPDVIILDLEMPRMDGLTFLRKVMAEDPIPVVICSGHAQQGTQAALQALAEGAVEVVTKPRVGVREFLEESAVLLIDAVRAAALASLHVRRPVPAPDLRPGPRYTADAVLPAPRPSSRPAPAGGSRVVALGASTGGTEALRVLLEALPVNAPPIVIVQHMPEVFTAAFAQRLNQTCRIEVKEAADGDAVIPGRALIAPGNQHLLLARQGAGYVARLAGGPLVSRHRPSVDVLFRSVAQAAGRNAVGVILTGMGDDGAQGLLEMRQAGAATLAQSEATCVVFGMPKEAIERDAVDEIVPLPLIGPAILSRAAGHGD